MTKAVFIPKAFTDVGKQMFLICYKWQNKMNGFHLEMGENKKGAFNHVKAHINAIALPTRGPTSG